VPVDAVSNLLPFRCRTRRCTPRPCW
jgi:hypothetical protein